MAPIQDAMMHITNDMRDDLRQIEESLNRLENGDAELADSLRGHVARLVQLHRAIRTKVNILATILTTDSDEILRDVRREEGCNVPGE